MIPGHCYNVGPPFCPLSTSSPSVHVYSRNVRAHFSCGYVDGMCNIFLQSVSSDILCLACSFQKKYNMTEVARKGIHHVCIITGMKCLFFSQPLFPFSFKLDGRNSPSRFSSSAILLVKICLETRFLHMKMCVLISPFCVSLFLSQV